MVKILNFGHMISNQVKILKLVNWSKIRILAKKLNTAKTSDFCLKTLNFWATISTGLEILKVGNFYHSQMQSGQKIRILAKKLNSGKNFEFCLFS